MYKILLERFRNPEVIIRDSLGSFAVILKKRFVQVGSNKVILRKNYMNLSKKQNFCIQSVLTSIMQIIASHGISVFKRCVPCTGCPINMASPFQIAFIRIEEAILMRHPVDTSRD